MVTRRTGSGDRGTTDLLGRRRVSKSDAIIEALGDVDEATSHIGLARAAVSWDGEWGPGVLEQVQRDLYGLMSELAMPPNHSQAHRLPTDRLEWLDRTLVDLKGRIAIPNEFVLPGSTVGGGHLDVARAVVRRAERAVVRVLEAGADDPDLGYPTNPILSSYLNRLSLVLYFMARLQEAESGGSPRLASSQPS